MLRDSGLAKIWRQYFGTNDLLFFTLLIPLIVLLLSLLHYTSRKNVYLAWLAYSVLGLFAFTLLLIAIDDNVDFVDRMFVRGLGGIYIAGSLLIWLYGVITHFFIKK